MSTPGSTLASGLALLALLALGALSAPAHAAEPPLTGDGLLSRLTDPVRATAPLPEGARVIQRSSHEREGGNRDWGVWSPEAGRPQTYVRREQGGFVLLDERRPGCLTRMWFTAGAVLGVIDGVGRIELFFDGEREPRVDVPAADFFAGRVPGFPQPLVGNSDSSSGGFYSYVPFCFRRSLKVRVSDAPNEELWYQLTALVLPHGSRVRTYEPGALATGAAAEALAGAGAPPPGDPVGAERALAPGDSLEVLRRAGSGSVRHLRFAVTPFLPDTLNRLRLRVGVDGAATPQIDVPLGALLGDGLAPREIRSLPFGMDPVTGTGYFALPIPFADSISVSIGSRTAAQVRAEAWLGPPLPAAGVLNGRQFVEESRRGFDFTALEAGGSGRLAAWVLDLIGAPGSDRGPLQFFLEGDERVHVDGSRSPSIYGTGTEDAFNGGFYYNRGPFSLPTHGAGLFLSRGDTRGARSQYRVFGADGFLWENGIRFGMEHGGGDELDGQTTISTAFWYSGPRRLRRTDVLRLAKRRSRRAHRLRGRVTRARLTAYFVGERDGNGTFSPYPLTGGREYPAPPPEESPQAHTARGISFTSPVSFRLRVGRRNCGVVLRRLLDAGGPSTVRVRVDGRRVGPWRVTEPNPAKRWLADDFALHSRHTAGKRRIRVRLAPERGTTATAFSVTALARRARRCP